MSTYSHSAAALLEYPFRRPSTPDSAVTAAFAAICAYKLKLVRAKYTVGNLPQMGPADLKFDGTSIICSVRAADYAAMTWLSDYFNEKQRLQARRSDEIMSPYDYWATNKLRLIAALPDPTTAQALSDAVYGNIHGCGNFRPYLLTGFARYFGAKRILDPSAGWGDRLIGAIAAADTVTKYVGVDPNAALHPGYAEIISRFAAEPARYQMIVAPFQDYEPGAEQFDLVFTSPPYFDHEIYSADPTQSVVEFPTLDEWFDGFLMVLVAKSAAALATGGHLVLVINDCGRHKYIARLLAAAAKMPELSYRGVISYAEQTKNGHRSPQPMWIWRRN